MTSTSNSAGREHGAEPSSTSLEVANLPLDHAARLLAVADGLCAIGQLRTGERAGQFSIFNFLLRCAPDDEVSSPDKRTAYAVLMQAGIIRRHGWYAHVWLPEDDSPLRLSLPAPIAKSWRWHDDIVEISKRLERSDTWMQAVGESVDDHIERLRVALVEAEVVKSMTA